MKRIVVTGGAGFIGSHTVDALVRRGDTVVVIDTFATGKRENLDQVSDRITLVEGSITDPTVLGEAFRGADAVMHLAALPSVPKSVALPLQTHETNATGTLRVFLAARDAGVKRVVYASSSSVYGDTPTLPKVETMPTRPLSPYAIQKLMGEQYGRVFASLFGLETIGLRYFNVFGPRQDPASEYAAVIPKFITLIRDGHSPVVNGDGEHTRDFTFIENVVAANLAALDAVRGFGDVYNVATGSQISLNTLIARITTELSSSVVPTYGPERVGDIRDSFADISKARATFGYTPSISFDDGIRKTISSFTYAR